jgi:type I restriction enzyme, S subunit
MTTSTELAEWPFPDVVDFQEGPGILAKDFRRDGTPLVRLSGLDVGASVLNGCNYLSPEMVARKWSHFCLKEGDILLSTSASLGRVAVVGKEGVGAIPYTGLIRMRPRDERLIAPFIPYLLGGQEFQQQVEAAGVGSVIRHFGPMHLRRMTVRLPPPDSQKKIAHILGTLDQKIELNSRMNDTLEAMAGAIFQSWFVDFDPVRAKAAGESFESISQRLGLTPELLALFPDDFEVSFESVIPAGWIQSTLGEQAKSHGGFIQTGPFGSQLHAADYVDKGIPVVMPQDLVNRRVSVARAARVTEEMAERLSRHALQPGDVVYSRRGDVERHALVSERESGWLCGTGCLLVRLGHSWPSQAYLSEALDLPTTREWLVRHAVGATMPNLNTSILGDVPLLIPPAPLMEAFEKIAGSLRQKQMANSLESESLAETRDALLPKLLSGELALPELGRLGA